MSDAPSLPDRLRAEIAHAEKYELPIDLDVFRLALADVELAEWLNDPNNLFAVWMESRNTPDIRRAVGAVRARQERAKADAALAEGVAP
jgi:hypothetical protein